MRQFILYSSILVFLGVCGCNFKAKDKTLLPPSPPKDDIQLKLSQLASDKDHVCGMSIEEGSITDTASYNGKLYGFCAAECKAEFLKSPDTYLSQQ